MNATIRRGQIWRTLVPFGGDVIGAKERTAAIMGWSPFADGEDKTILIVPISTFGGDSSKARVGDLPPTDWVTSRLASNSFIRTRRMMALNPQAIVWDKGPVGMLHSADMSAILVELQRLLSGSSSVEVQS